MKTKVNSDNTTGSFVVVPGFSLLASPIHLDERTAEAFTFADAKGRRMLFGMRKMIGELFPSGITENLDINDYVNALIETENVLHTVDSPANVSVIFPGVIPPALSQDCFEKLATISGHFTLDLRQDNTPNLLRFIRDKRAHSGKKINVITDRTVPTNSIKTICDLWNMGADITLCYGRAAGDTLRKTGFSAEIFDITDGILTIPGKTLVKCISFDAPDDKSIEYSQIKGKLQTLIENEIAERFSVSSKGKLYYSSDSKYDCLDSLGLFYDECISKKDGKIRNIFSGGAKYDIIALVLQGCSDTMLRYVSAACVVFDGEYPIKVVPVLQDVQYVDNLGDMRSIITDHARKCRNAYGGSILELKVPERFDLTNYRKIANMISALFGTGGLMIRIRKEAE